MTTTFFHLPQEDIVFPLIFHHLDTVVVWRLRCVCRSLRKLCEDYFETFCPTISFREIRANCIESKYLQDRACILRALRACKRLKHVSLYLSSAADCAGSTTSTNTLQKTSCTLFNSICHMHPGCRLVSLALVNVDCSRCSDVGSSWEGLGERCRTLEELHIEDVSQFNDVCLENVAKTCTSLLRLTLKSLPRMQGVYLPRLAEKSMQLEMMNVSKRWIQSFTLKSYMTLPSSFLDVPI